MVRHSEEYKRLSKRLTKKISKANKRYDRLKQAGWKTPAIEAMGDRRFHNLRSMSYREMQKEERRVDNFLQAKTSSKTGVRRSVNRMMKNTGMDKKFKTSDVMGNRNTMAKYFKVYLKMREYDRVKGIGRTYQASFNAITSYFESHGTGGSVDDILDSVISSLDIKPDDNFDKDETFTTIIG